MNGSGSASILTAIRELAGGPARPADRDRGHPYYNIPTPELRRLARQQAKLHRELDCAAFCTLLDSLYRGESFEEKTIASMLLEYLPRLRRQIAPVCLGGWLDQLRGWAEIDSLCTGCFSADEMLSDWPAWEALLRSLAADPLIGKRRAALVLLTGPVRTSEAGDLADLAFATVDQLRSEREILMTKAVSWLLRSLVPRHRARVEEYLNSNAAQLPAIAVRETRNKLLTGRKQKRAGVNPSATARA